MFEGPNFTAAPRIHPTPVLCWDVFIAEGNEGLNDTKLPGFASYANSSAVVTRHDNLSCPIISGQQVTGRSVRLSIDPSYLGYSHCVCVEGMEVLSVQEEMKVVSCWLVHLVRFHPQNLNTSIAAIVANPTSCPSRSPDLLLHISPHQARKRTLSQHNVYLSMLGKL